MATSCTRWIIATTSTCASRSNRCAVDVHVSPLRQAYNARVGGGLRWGGRRACGLRSHSRSFGRWLRPGLGGVSVAGGALARVAVVAVPCRFGVTKWYVQCGANATRSLLIRKYICVCMLRSITLDISLSPVCSFDLIPSARTFEKDSARLFRVPASACGLLHRRTGGTCQHTTIMLHLQSHLRHRPLTLRGAPCPPCLCARLLSVGKRYLDRRTP